ncbi:MAG: hypothetical protein V4721_00450 [Bacteroidota bacterium]
MPYILVENFNGGLDRRRKISTAPPGTLWELVNAHITRGGEIQKRKAFIEEYDLPEDTHGLSALTGDLYVFGSVETPSGIPAGINYQRLQHPSGSPTSAAMTEVVDVEVFNGKLYVIARYEDNSTFHFYDGQRIPYWDAGTVQGGATSTADIAAALAAEIDSDSAYIATVSSSVITVTAAVAGVPFTIAGTVSGSGTIPYVTTVPSVPAISEQLAVGSFNITGGTSNPGTNMMASVTVNGVTITSAAVDWTGSNENTAALIAANITAYTSVPNYTATSIGTQVVISAVANSGSSPNGYAVVAVEAGNVTHDTEVAMAGGVTAVAGVAQVTQFTVTGSWEAGDTYQILLNGTEFGGTTANYTAIVLDKKVYVTGGSLLRFCKVNTPTEWDENITSNVGAGFINISNHFSGSDSLTGQAVYQNYLAVFSQSAIQIWNVKSDEEQNEPFQKINSVGSVSPKSILSFSDSDVLFLANSGVRTLKARDSSNQAISNDIGRPVDKLIIEQVATLTSDEIRRASAIVDPIDGRYWLALKNKIFVYSSFREPGQGNISAWSMYEPGFNVDNMLVVNKKTYIRSGDTIYLYGGSANTTYDASEVTIQLPFLDAKKPADFKELLGLNVDCEGEFFIEALVDPRDLNQKVDVGDVDGFTYLDGLADMIGDTTHFAPRLTSTYNGEVTLSNLAVHYEALGATP